MSATIGEKRAAAPGQIIELPQKKFYRARAHVNVLNDTGYDAPNQPDDYDWAQDFPEFFERARGDNPSTSEGVLLDTTVRFADIGCG